MTAPVIQLSDRAVHAQHLAEPRIEVMAYLHESERHIDGAYRALVRDDLLGVARELKEMRRMVKVGYERADELTREVAKWEKGNSDDAA